MIHIKIKDKKVSLKYNSLAQTMQESGTLGKQVRLPLDRDLTGKLSCLMFILIVRQNSGE